MRDDLLDLLRAQQDQLKVRSHVVRPAVGLLVAASPIVAAMVWAGPAWLQAIGALLGSFAVLTPFAGYIYFAVKDPDRLGTETFVMQQEVLRAAAKDPKIARAMAASVALMADPAPPPSSKQKQLKTGSSDSTEGEA